MLLRCIVMWCGISAVAVDVLKQSEDHHRVLVVGVDSKGGTATTEKHSPMEHVVHSGDRSHIPNEELAATSKDESSRTSSRLIHGTGTMEMHSLVESAVNGGSRSGVYDAALSHDHSLSEESGPEPVQQERAPPQSLVRRQDEFEIDEDRLVKRDPQNDSKYKCSDGSTFATYNANTLTPEQKKKADELWPGKPASYYACTQGCKKTCSANGEGVMKKVTTTTTTTTTAAKVKAGALKSVHIGLVPLLMTLLLTASLAY